MRVIAMPIMAALFFLWVLYRLLIKKDLKKHRKEVLIGLCFVAVWSLIFGYIYSY